MLNRGRARLATSCPNAKKRTSSVARLVVAPHAAAAAPLRKGAVKDVQRAVVGRAVLGVGRIAQVMPQPHPHRVAVVVAANLRPRP